MQPPHPTRAQPCPYPPTGRSGGRLCPLVVRVGDPWLLGALSFTVGRIRSGRSHVRHPDRRGGTSCSLATRPQPRNNAPQYPTRAQPYPNRPIAPALSLTEDLVVRSPGGTSPCERLASAWETLVAQTRDFSLLP